VEIAGFMNKVGGIFDKGGGFSYKGLKFINKKMSKGLGRGSYGAHYGSKRNALFMDFWLLVDPRGAGVMRKKTLLDGGIKGGGFDGFRYQAGDGINKVFIKSFVSRGGKKVEQFRFVIEGIHNDSSNTFVRFEDHNIRVIIKPMNEGEMFFGKVRFRRLRTTKDSSSFLFDFFRFMNQ
jgi:hypothetical protein